MKAWDEYLFLEAAHTMDFMPEFQHGLLQQLPQVLKPTALATLMLYQFSTWVNCFCSQIPLPGPEEGLRGWGVRKQLYPRTKPQI